MPVDKSQIAAARKLDQKAISARAKAGEMVVPERKVSVPFSTTLESMRFYQADARSEVPGQVRVVATNGELHLDEALDDLEEDGAEILALAERLHAILTTPPPKKG